MRYYYLLFCLLFSGIMHAQNSHIREAMQNYDYEKALILIDAEPPTPAVNFQKGLALKGLNRYPEAIATLEQLTLNKPNHLQALAELAECYKLNGKYNDAFRCYEAARTLNPKNKYFILQQINLLCNSEQYEKARILCEQVIVADSSAVNLRTLGICYEGVNHPNSAQICYEKALEKVPNDMLSVNRLANLYINTTEYQKAIDLTENYRHTDSTQITINRQNAMAYCLTKQYEKAIDRYLSLINNGDSTYLTYYYLGASYFGSENFYEAHDFLEKAYKTNPENVNLLYLLGKACYKTSWKKEGMAYINTAIDLTIPKDEELAKLYKALAESAGLNGLYLKQIEALKKVYQYDPTYKYSLYLTGMIYDRQLHDTKKAIKYLEAFLKTKPNDKEDETTATFDEKTGQVTVNTISYYQAAKRALEKLKAESFFKEGIKE